LNLTKSVAVSTTGQPDDDQVFEPGLVHKKSRALERGRGA